MIRFLFRQSWQLAVVAGLASIASGISGAMLIGLITKGLAVPSSLPSLALPFLGWCFASLLAKSAAEVSLLHLTQSAVLHLRTELSRKLIATPFARLQSIGKAELMAVLTNDIGTFTNTFQMLPSALSNGILIVVCLGYMAWLSPLLLLLFLAFFTIGLVAYKMVERNPQKLNGKLREQVDHLYQNFRGLVEGVRELKINATRAEAFVHHELGGNARAYRRTFVQTMSGYIWAGNIGTALFYLVLGAVLFVVPAWLPQSAQTLSSFTLILLYLMGPISHMVGLIPAMRHASVSLSKISRLGETFETHTSVSTPAAAFPASTGPLIEFRNVRHRHIADAEQVFELGPINLTIRQNEVLYIVGGNGSGKTTLSLLLLRLYEPDSGELFFHGVPVTNANAALYQANFSAVFADFHLFASLFGRPGANVTANAQRYLEQFGLAAKTSIADERFSTIDLSSGQRKRLALVAAYLEDRDIYVFDEWAADQDPMFKRIFYTKLVPELKARGKTVIIITHDDSYFQFADRVIKLEDGRLLRDTAVASSDCLV